MIATKAELDGWVKASPIRQDFRLRNLDQEGASPAQAISRGISEMKRLRKEMFELGNEVKRMLRALQVNIYELQGELNGRAWRDSSPLYSEDERNLLTGNTSDLMAVPKKYPKAS